MKKLRHKKEINKKDSGDEESDDADIFERKSFRIKNSKIKSRAKEKSQGNDEYDADSEPESCKIEEATQSSFSSDCSSKLQSVDKKKKKKKLKDLYQSIQDCYVSVKDVHPIKRGTQYKKISKIDANSLENNTISTTEKKGSSFKKKISKLKENITPLESYSTPSKFGKVARNLNESLFGFDNVERKLEYSSLNETTTLSSKSSLTKKEKLTSKRKFDNTETLESVDIPMELCKKKTKRKKSTTKVPPTREENHEYWENLRLEFEEVEMHELIIEDC